jgi:hypothetical protein
VNFRHHLVPGGGVVKLTNKTSMAEVVLIRNEGKPLPTMARSFQHEYDLVFKDKDKVTVENVLRLARWALEHGLTSKCAEMLDKATEMDKTNAVAVAWTKTKADLARPLSKEDVAAAWKGRLLEGYRVTQTDNHHHVLLHDVDNPPEMMAHLDRLENSFRAYYYWWVLHGTSLPVPKTHLVAVVAEKDDDFKRLQKHLTASPLLTDSFFARREGLAVFAAKRNDLPYQTLKVISAPYWDKGFEPRGLLTSKPRAGVPKSAWLDPAAADEPRVLAVVMKAMEREWEATGISHETSRQLLFASELLPANVVVPEWLQFGMASFFESPLHSPWGGMGAPSVYWLPRYKELQKNKKLGKSPYDTLVKVVTDSYFRKPELLETKDGTIRKGRAASWALAYFLAQKELDGLKRYFKELGKMPRDLELDEQVLLTAFARAFDCVDADRKINVAKLTTLAKRWDNFIKDQPLESETIHQKIREAFARMNKPPSSSSGTGAGTGPMPGGGMPGGLPGTGRPGAGGLPGTGRPGAGGPGTGGRIPG